MTSSARIVSRTTRANNCKTAVADGMPVTVVDRFEMIKIEGKHADRHDAFAIASHEHPGSLKKSAAIKQAGKRICGRCGLIEVNGAIFCQYQHHERRADDVQQYLDRKHRDPAAGETMDAVVGRNCRERYGKQEDRPVQHWNEISQANAG